MNYSKTIREYCKQNPGMVFDMSYEHHKHFEMVPYKTFCKILSRIEEEGIIKPYSKGIYIISSDNMSEDPVIAFYANENTGVVVGYKMYNDFGITDHFEKPIVQYEVIFYNVLILVNEVMFPSFFSKNFFYRTK